ncbi:MAG: antitoxin Xre/MbcA/ParS toxin-binding domain-containing protein [Nitrospirota bacterium]
MGTLTQALPSRGKDRIPARDVRAFIQKLIKATGVPERLLAQAVAMAESQLNRMTSKKAGSFKEQTVHPLKRIAILVEEAQKVLTPKGVKEWINTPNPYLNDVPPILCLRSDKELEKVLSLLASIRYGFPA